MVRAKAVRAPDILRGFTRRLFPDAAAPSTSDVRLSQAGVFAEAARRVDEPLDLLPSGDATIVSALLWQRAATWAAAAAGAFPDGARGEEVRDLLERIAGGSESFAFVETLMKAEVARPDAQAFDITPHLATLKTFSEKLIDELERPARAERRKHMVKRWRLVAGLAAVAALIWVIAGWTRPPDLVPSARRAASSEYYPCSTSPCGDALFHTVLEKNPWVSYDFGAQKELHGIDVRNRMDCCGERAVPLVVETSNDARHWTQQARTDELFVTWSPKLRGRARYVRLRVARESYLHLSAVSIH
jgi:hypothetical protein